VDQVEGVEMVGEEKLEEMNKIRIGIYGR